MENEYLSDLADDRVINGVHVKVMDVVSYTYKDPSRIQEPRRGVVTYIDCAGVHIAGLGEDYNLYYTPFIHMADLKIESVYKRK